MRNPGKINMKPENPLLEKEKSSEPNLYDLMFPS